MPIIEVGDILISSAILTEKFCCDLSACGGACCIEGDAGAPVTLDEIAAIEDSLDAAWPLMSASAQSVVDRQGVACTDPEGELVTSIVNGKDCVFTFHENRCCLCALERVCAEGKTHFQKPISCALYPIREKHFAGGLVGLNLHHWVVCDAAFKLGEQMNMPVYRFLRQPLIRRFGQEWYNELETVAAEFEKQALSE